MFKYFSGFLRDDQRHVVKFHGSYDLSGLTLGATFLYASGTPLTKQFQNPVDAFTTARRSPTGTEPFASNDTASIAEFRIPDQIVVNARVSYDFYRLIRSHLIFIVDLFNLFNLSQPTSLENRDGATFGAAIRGRQSPFRLQLGLRYIY
jgi:hypothetical protein